MRRTRRVPAFTLAATLALSAPGPATVEEPTSPLQPPTVEILRPAVGEPLLGSVEIEARVRASESEAAPMELEAFLDGRSLGPRQAPPWRWRTEVGSEMREHRVEVRARIAGEEVRAVRITPWVRIDDRLEAELQTVYVTVTDGRGERVADLPRSAFRISDQNRPQRIVTFEHGDLPLTAALLLDTSISMEGERLVAAVAGARSFLSGLRPLDETRVMTFSDRLRLLSATYSGHPEGTPPAPLDPELDTALRDLEPTDGTAIHDHLYLALHLLESRPGRRVLVLLSDGVDWQSVLPVEEVERVARRSQALLYWVRLDGDAAVTRRNIAPGAWSTPEDKLRSFRRLEDVVRESGGRIVRLREAGEIEGAFRDVLRELREQYALGYYPRPELGHDGGWREVEVEVSPPGLEVRVRAGYIDRER